MLYNTTFTNNDDLATINNILGKPFNLIETFKLKGVGSSRFTLHQLSPNMHMKLDSSMSYGNIELRPRGIIVHFSINRVKHAWIIPFYKLVIYSTEVFSIHANGKFIQLKKDKNYKNNKKFIEKMLQQKLLFSNM